MQTEMWSVRQLGLAGFPLSLPARVDLIGSDLLQNKNEQPYYQLVSALGYELCTIHKFTSVLEL